MKYLQNHISKLKQKLPSRFLDPFATGNHFAHVLKNLWTTRNECRTDVMIFSLEDWLTEGDMIIVSSTPFVYTNFSRNFTKFFGANFTKNLDHQLRHLPTDLRNVGDTVYEVLDVISGQISKEMTRRKSRKLTNKRTPTWAIVVLATCSVLGIVLALVGQCATSDRRAWASLTATSSGKKAGQWKMGFSGGVWAKWCRT